MSLLWPNQHQLLIAFGAEHLSLVYRTSFSKKVIAEHHESFNELGTQPSWKKAITQLDIQLEKLNLAPHTNISLTLASDLVRMIVLPGHEIAISNHEKQGYAEAAYREIYGAAVDSWKICVDDTPPAQPTIACAIDQSLIDALENLAHQYQLSIRSLQPYVMTAFNRLYSSLKNASASFVIIEPTRIDTLLLQDGVCQQIQIDKFSHDWQSKLEQALTRNQLVSDYQSKEIMIYAPSLSTTKMEFSNQFSAKRLSLKKSSFAMRPGYSMLEALA